MKRLIILTGLTLLLTSTVIGWICYVPPAALNRLAAVPANALFVYTGHSINWPLLKTLPATRDIFRALEQEPKMPSMLREFFNGPATVAAAPLGGRDRRDTFILVSATGPRAVALRWRLDLFPSEGIRRVRSYYAWPVWEIEQSALPAWMRVRFALSEGLFICSISDDSHDIYYLLDTLDGRRPSLAGRKNGRAD